MTNPATSNPTTRKREPKRERVFELKAKGLKVREIAALCALSTQRVYQILDAREPEPSEESA
jgi:hypothetical protein